MNGASVHDRGHSRPPRRIWYTSPARPHRCCSLREKSLRKMQERETVTERCPGGTTGVKVRKVRYSRKLGSLRQSQVRTMAMIYYRATFGTESSDFRSQGSWCRGLAGGVSETNQSGRIVIGTTQASVGHRYGELHQSVAGR